MKAPILRFKNNRGEEFGEWESKTIADIAEVNPKSNELPERFIYIDLESVQRGQLLKETSILSVDAPSRAQRVLYENDVLFQLVRPYQKNNLLFKRQGAYVASTGYAQLRTKESADFLYQLIHIDSFTTEVINRCTGTSYPAINSSDLGTIEIRVPCLPEQTKIANFLSEVDKRIQQLSQTHTLLTQYKKGVMQKIFSQELRFKDENGEEFGEWESKTIADIAEVNPKSNELPERFIYIDLESVQRGQLLKETSILSVDAPSRAQRVLYENDVLFQLVRPYQKNNLLFKRQGAYVASTGYAQLRTKESADFLYQLIHIDSFTTEVINRCTGTSYPAINSSDLGTIEIRVPCLPEQTKIANFLSAIDDKIHHTQTQLTALQEYKRGLLQQLFV